MDVRPTLFCGIMTAQLSFLPQALPCGRFM
jgi:hypothetical protein